MAAPRAGSLAGRAVQIERDVPELPEQDLNERGQQRKDHLRHFSQFLAARGQAYGDVRPPDALALLAYLRRLPSRRPARRLAPVLTTMAAGAAATCLAPATVNRILAAVSSFYEHLIVAEALGDTENPVLKVEDLAAARVAERRQPFIGRASRQRPVRRFVQVRTVQRLPRPLSDDQVQQLLSACRTRRDRALLLLMLQGGLRPGEVLNLRLGDIEYGRRRVIVRHSTDHPRGARTKSRVERVVDLHEPEALAALSDYVLRERPDDADSPFVFLLGGRGRRRQEPLSYAALVKLFARQCDRLGIRDPWVTPHALRHTHATAMFEGGMRELTLQKRLGHASPEVDAPLHARVGRPRCRGVWPGARAGATGMSTALLLQAVPRFAPRHLPAEAYRSVLRERGIRDVRQSLRRRRAFVDRYPRLEDWLIAPLPERVGHLHGEVLERMTCRVAYDARSYLYRLVQQGCLRLDDEWLLAIQRTKGCGVLAGTALLAGIDRLTQEAVRLGYSPARTDDPLRWAVGRLFLPTGKGDVDDLTRADIEELRAAVGAFGERPDLTLYYPSAAAWDFVRKQALGSLPVLWVVLYHRGQVAEEPHFHRRPAASPPPPPPRMAAAVARYLAQRRAEGCRPRTVEQLDHGLRRFIAWLAGTHPAPRVARRRDP